MTMLEDSNASLAHAPLALLLALLAAHLVGDFLLQTDADVQHKRRPLRFAKHIAIITVLSYAFLGAWTQPWIPLAIGLTHALIDRLKLLAEHPLGWKGRAPFLLDQVAHVTVLLVIAFVVPEAWRPAVGWVEWIGPTFLQGCLLLSGAIVTIFAGGFLIGMSVDPYLAEIAASPEARPGGGDGAGLARGGMVIGQLERALIFFFVLVGQPEAVAFLVAAKSVFRFGELSRHRKEAEYILIGTLMSFGWGLVAAWLTGWSGRVLGLL